MNYGDQKTYRGSDHRQQWRGHGLFPRVERTPFADPLREDGFFQWRGLHDHCRGTGETLWTEENVDSSATRAPRQATHSTAGVAALYAGSGQAVNDKIVLAADRVKIVIASGGDTKTGTFHIVVE